jgi:hypothetical protein
MKLSKPIGSVTSVANVLRAQVIGAARHYASRVLGNAIGRNAYSGDVQPRQTTQLYVVVYARRLVERRDMANGITQDALVATAFAYRAANYGVPRISGSPSFPEPMTTTFALADSASLLVASIPLHRSSGSLIPSLTMR